jgi:hypothetical protein
MNSKLERIAAILGLTLNATVVEETLSAEMMTKDGAKLYTEAEGFVVGSAVMVVAEDGSMVPAMAGEVEVEDGSIFVMDEAGIILEIKAPEAPEEVAPEVAAEEMADETSFALSEEDYNALIERIAKLEEVLLGAVEALNATNKELVEKVETLSAAPGAAPVKTRKPIKEENALAGLKLPKRN